MPKLNNPMEIFKLLDKSNCRRCNEATCLAFAAAVYQGRKQLGECTHLDRDVVERFEGAADAPNIDRELDETLAQMKAKLAGIDLAAAAEKVGGHYERGKLTIKVLGKDFSVDESGHLFSDIHVNSWVAIPFFNYILKAGGVPPGGNWVPFRELENGTASYPLFNQRCEKPLKRIADTYTELFEDMIHLFNGKQVENHYASDVSLVLRPLPNVPVLICYWRPEDGLESSLNLFFDATAEENLPVGSIYTLGAGLVRMFEKISLRHGAMS